MRDSTGAWNIRDLSNLILGPSQRPSENILTSLQNERSAEPVDFAVGSSDLSFQSVLLILNPSRPAVEEATRYAEYWSNRGETLGVFWIGDSGIKAGFFDCSRQAQWADACAASIQSSNYPELRKQLTDHISRLVIVHMAHSQWWTSPFVQAGLRVCVALDPTSDQVVWGYEVLKCLVEAELDVGLSCFVVNAKSALEAERLSQKLQRIGEHFLSREIVNDGFSLMEKWPTTNLVAEAFAPATGGTDCLYELLLQLSQTDLSWLLEDKGESITANRGILNEPPVVTCDAIPEALLISADQAIQTSEQLDRCILNSIAIIYDDVIETWPVYESSRQGCFYRWVRRQNGVRSLLVSTVGDPAGVLEHASAKLYPSKEHDEIAVFSCHINTDCRRAAQSLSVSTRLYELTRVPRPLDPSLILKDVTQALS